LNQLLRKPLDNVVNRASARRVYILQGTVVKLTEQKRGLIELLIQYYDNEKILGLNFARSTGYMWVNSIDPEELDLPQTILHSIESISGGTATGQGHFSDMYLA
jgi:hypothetical protein